jgi:hypothetical protein
MDKETLYDKNYWANLSKKAAALSGNLSTEAGMKTAK